MSFSPESVSTNDEDTLNSIACDPVENGNVVTRTGAGTAAADFWQAYLAEIPGLELPTDRPRPAALGSAMGLETHILSEELRDGLRSFNGNTGTAGLAAFAAMLYRYTAQERFAIAVEHENATALPIIADFSDQPSFRDLVNRFEDAICNCEQAGRVPFDLAEQLGIAPDPSRHPVFQVAYSTVPPSIPAATRPGLDLRLELVNSRQLTLHYNQALFESSTAKRMLCHLQQLLAGACENASRSAMQLPMLTPQELHEHLVVRNNTARDIPAVCLHELFETSAAKSPDEIAVIYEQQQLTYAELNARANQLAHFLQKRGIGRNTRVGICLKRSLDFAVAILAVLKAGGICVPLDPTYPSERLSFMLSDVSAPIVLTERGLLQAVIPDAAELVYVSESRELIASESRANLRVGSGPSDIAYVIYTSGSTGRPRGVLLAHSGLANYMPAAAEMFALRPGDRMLQFCSISFDAALEEIYTTWAAGATLVFRRDDLSLEPSVFLDWVSQQRITVMDLPTAYWHEWVYALPGLPEKVPSALRLVIVGGEKASPEAFAVWHKAIGNRVRWINTYGPAEASVVALTYEPKLKADEPAPAVLPIGRPVANARVYLLDSQLNPVPVGVPGELHIGGAGVAKGYLNQPQRTAEKFIKDIFSDDPSARMYKTGDLGRYTASGEIEFMGRRDNQVKIRGFRIEPGEIESVLARHPGVQDSAVVVREDASGGKRLMGYVVRVDGKAPSEAELRRHLQKHLPEYMVPSEFVFLETMPLTPNGKINRRALSTMKIDSESTAREEVVNDPLQAQLINIWEGLLGRSPIGVRDNFFQLGGHSLLAARLMHHIRQDLGKTLPLAALLQAPTIEQLAAVLREDLSQYWSSLVAIQPDGSKPPFFMVHGVGGNVVGFVELAQHMKPDYPFYGLQSQGLDGKRECLTSISAMAAHYLEEIRTVQPHGPYHLGGFSLGGVVAYEMAQQLRARGEEVGLLVLFDTYATTPKPVSVLDLLRKPGRVRFTQLPTEIRKKIRRTLLMKRLPEVLKTVMRTNAQAAEHYTFQPYEGKVVLLRAGDTWRVDDDPFAKWKQLVGELENIEIRGAHMDILRDPNVSRLAEHLKGCIDKASLAKEALAGNSSSQLGD